MKITLGSIGRYNPLINNKVNKNAYCERSATEAKRKYFGIVLIVTTNEFVAFNHVSLEAVAEHPC